MRCHRLFVVPLLLGLAGATRAEETRMVPVTVDGEPVRLEMRIYAPRTDRPVPTLVFNARLINQTLFTRGARYPGSMIWLYGDDDAFYALSHSAENFLAFQAAGGRGTFHALMPAIPQGGHRIISRPGRWESLLDEYLQRQGLARP